MTFQAAPSAVELVALQAGRLTRLEEQVAFLEMTNRDLSTQFNAAKRVALRHGATDAEITAAMHEPE
jgi:hypothetical protein